MRSGLMNRNTIRLNVMGDDGKIINRRGETVNAPDYILMLLVSALTVFGVVMVFSASYYNSINYTGSPYSYLWSQGFYALTGFGLMMFASIVDYHFIEVLAKPIGVIGLILLLLVLTPLGIEAGGATRWLKLGVTIMPGEIAKAVTIIVGAAYFAEDMIRAKRIKGVAIYIAYTILICFLIYKQPNMSTAITVFIIAMGVGFVAGIKWRYIFTLVGAAIAGVVVIALKSDNYLTDRLKGFLNPFENSLDEGFQASQSLIAFGTGGLTGKGLGQSVQKNLYLPEPQNDFILAIIGEELGYIGILILYITFALVIWRVLRIAIRSRDNFGLLFASGVAIMIGAQLLLNIAVVTAIMPPTGIALPFISAGGNALWIFMGLIGVVLNISRHTIPVEDNE